MLGSKPQARNVSIIIPMRNEERHILDVLRSIRANSHPKPHIEIIIIDGMSADRSVDLINDFSESHPELSIRVIKNPKITIPHALNIAINAASHEFIIRMDCHAEYHHDYIRNSIENLLNLPNAVGTGGVISAAGISETGKAIALALTSKLGNGGANYRFVSTTSASDTIWCGCWRRSDAIKAGLFDTSKDANEDFEFNQRLKKFGEIYTCPDVIAKQYVRESFSALFSQYKRYGFWKATVVKTNPNNFQIRQMIPFVFFTGLLLSAALLSLSPWPLLILSGSYITAIIFAPVQLNTSNACQHLKVSLALLIMHCAWFTGVIKGLFTRQRSA